MTGNHVAFPDANPSRTPAARDPAALGVTEVCTDLRVDSPSPDEIYRYLGYAPGAAPGRGVAERIPRIAEAAHLRLQPRGTFSLYAVTARTPRSMTLGGTAISGNVSEFLAPADRVAIFVVTVGDAISHLAAHSRQEDDALAQWVIDAFGSWAAEAAADALMERIQRHAGPGESLTVRYSPGYCGMEIAQQRALFSMVPADAIGVKLLPSLLMYPLKSISGLVGLGPAEAVKTDLTPCDHCERVGCHMRR